MNFRHCVAGGLSGVERAGEGPGVLLVHGNSADHRTFGPLMASRALAGQRLVALDLPGHGGSVDQPGRTLGALATAIAEAARALQVGVVFGHSLGGHATLQAVGRGRLDGLAGVAVLGTPPIPGLEGMGIAFQPAAAMDLIFKANVSDAEVALWAAEAFGPHQPPPAWFAEAVRATDPALRAGLVSELAVEGFIDEVAVLDTAPMPIAVLHAEDDAYSARAHTLGIRGRALWRGLPQILPGLGHYAPWEAPEVVGGVLAAFLEAVAELRPDPAH